MTIGVGGLALATDALNRDNPGLYIMLGGMVAFLYELVLFGASIGGFIATLTKKKALDAN